MFGTQNAFLFRDDLLNGGSVFRPAHKKKKKPYFIYNMALMSKTMYL